MAKLLLVYVNSFMDNLIPIGISILSSCLKQANHSVKLFDTTFYRTSEITGDEARIKSLQIKYTNLEEYGIFPKENMIDDFHKMIDEYQPDIIGLSIVESTWYIGKQLLNSLDKYPGIVIVGGIHATMAPQEVLSYNNVDIICMGEGEEAIVELANSVDKKQNQYNIRNLFTKCEGGCKLMK